MTQKIILDLCGGTGSWARPYKVAGYKVITITLPDYDVNLWSESGVLENAIYFTCIADVKKDLHIQRKDIYGILATPPCTMFSFARTNAKKPRDLKEGMKCVRSCLEIIWSCMEVQQDTTKKTLPLQFWALENPYHGFLKKFLGKPAFTFDPWEFGDGYQKRTALWGHFNEPIKHPVPMTEEMKGLAKTNSYLHTMKTGTNRGKPPSIWAKKDLVKFDMLASKDIHSEAFGVWDRQARRSITPAGFAEAFYKANK
jgi:hypothetical protein